MWDAIKHDIALLENLDKENQLFGAEYHRYQLRPVATVDELERCEAALGVALPQELRAFYSEVGNGIVGPAYGLLPTDRLARYYKPHLPFQGVEYFKELARQDGDLDDDGYFEAFLEDIHGLIPIIEEGCGHQVCLIATGHSVGRVVKVSCDGFLQEADRTLVELYESWLKQSIQVFKRVQELIETDLSMEEIFRSTLEEMMGYSVRDLITSFIGSPKPESLFGTRSSKIYGGPEQDLWYEEQLQRYRREQGVK